MADPILQLHFQLTETEALSATRRARRLRLGDVTGIIGSVIYLVVGLFLMGLPVWAFFSDRPNLSDTAASFVLGSAAVLATIIGNFYAVLYRTKNLTSPLTETTFTVFEDHFELTNSTNKMTVNWLNITHVLVTDAVCIVTTYQGFAAIPARILTPHDIASLRSLAGCQRHRLPKQTNAFPVQPSSNART